jgi:hypothetical protein
VTRDPNVQADRGFDARGVPSWALVELSTCFAAKNSQVEGSSETSGEERTMNLHTGKHSQFPLLFYSGTVTSQLYLEPVVRGFRAVDVFSVCTVWWWISLIRVKNKHSPLWLIYGHGMWRERPPNINLNLQEIGLLQRDSVPVIDCCAPQSRSGTSKPRLARYSNTAYSEDCLWLWDVQEWTTR